MNQKVKWVKKATNPPSYALQKIHKSLQEANQQREQCQRMFKTLDDATLEREAPLNGLQRRMETHVGLEGGNSMFVFFRTLQLEFELSGLPP